MVSLIPSPHYLWKSINEFIIQHIYYRIKEHTIRRRLEVEDTSIQILLPDRGSLIEYKFAVENELVLLKDLMNELSEEDIFFDVGANIGIHSMLADNKAKQVYAIEPSPNKYIILITK